MVFLGREDSELPKETGEVQSQLSSLNESQHPQFCEEEVFSAVEGRSVDLLDVRQVHCTRAPAEEDTRG